MGWKAGLAAALLLTATALNAHPSRGIVVAPDGRVYFSDLERIWSIGTDGRLRLVREHRGIHTHELAMTRGGDLIGEDSTYNPADQSYRESIWRISPSGRYSLVFGPVEALPRGVSVMRDARGCTWHANQTRLNGRPLVHRRCPGRPAERLVGSPADDRAYRPVLVSNVAGTAIGPDGSFYFRQGSAVRKVSPRGQVSLVVGGLAAENFGIALDPLGNVYVAEFSARRVLRIAPDGRRQVVASSAAPWGPTGVAYRDGAVFVLEATEYSRGVETRMRVRKIAGGQSRTLATVSIPLG